LVKTKLTFLETFSAIALTTFLQYLAAVKKCSNPVLDQDADLDQNLARVNSSPISGSNGQMSGLLDLRFRVVLELRNAVYN